LRAVLQCLGEDLSEDEIEDMIKEVDVDGDGRIDFDGEFLKKKEEIGISEVSTFMNRDFLIDPSIFACMW